MYSVSAIILAAAVTRQYKRSTVSMSGVGLLPVELFRRYRQFLSVGLSAESSAGIIASLRARVDWDLDRESLNMLCTAWAAIC